MDFVAKRYGLLPSQVMRLGDSIDIRCANLSVSYETYLSKKHQSGEPVADDHGLTQEQMLEMLRRTKEDANTNN